MKLSEIYPKPNLTIECEDLGMSTITNEIGDVILVYKEPGAEQRRVVWEKDKPLTEIFRAEFLNISKIKEVIDWNSQTSTILYNKCRDCKQYTIKEICELLKEDYIEIVNKKDTNFLNIKKDEYKIGFHDGKHKERYKWSSCGYLIINPNKEQEINNIINNDPCKHCEHFNSNLKYYCPYLKTCEKKTKYDFCYELLKYFKWN